MNKSFKYAALTLISSLVFASIYFSLPMPHNNANYNLLRQYNQAQLQRGFQIYRELCASCHSLNYVSLNSLSALGYDKEQINYLAKSYNISANDHLPAPFENEEQAREANNGSLPPDLSNIVKMRQNFSLQSGRDYVVKLLTGYQENDAGQNNNGYYNPYFYNGQYINMPPPLQDDIIKYSDNTPQTKQQYAEDVAAFLSWTSEPHLKDLHKIGFIFCSFVAIIWLLLYSLKLIVFSKIDGN